MSIVPKLLVSSFALVIAIESSAAYNADTHEMQIRRSCNSLRDSEERWGCFSGDIYMIEQIRRRQRAQGNYQVQSTYRTPSKTYRQPKQKTYEPALDQDDDAPVAVLTQPKKTPKKTKVVAKPAPATDLQTIPPLPSTPKPAKPEVDATTPKLIGGGDQIQDEAVTSSGKSFYTTADIMASINLGVPGFAPPKNLGTPATPPVAAEPETKPEVTVTVPQVAKPEAKPEVQVINPIKPEEQKPVAVKPVEVKPSLPTRFKMECATTTAQLNANPKLKAAISRILGVPAIGKGQSRKFGVRGQTREVGACFVFTSLESCGMGEAKSIEMRSTSEGRLQTKINESWADIKTCSDGEKIVSTYDHTEKGYTFNLKSIMKRNGTGKLMTETYGTWDSEKNDGSSANTNVLMSKGTVIQESSMIASTRDEGQRGRN